MTLMQLRYAASLAHCGSFLLAARECRVSQPTISLSIKKLEDGLGVTLFERAKGRILPTNTGQDFIKQARKVLDNADRLGDIAARGQKQLHHPLAIGAIFTVGPYLMPPLVRHLRRLAPQMPLVVEEGYTETLRDRLLSGSLDALLVALPFVEPGVATRRLYEEVFSVVMPKDHRLASRKLLREGDLASENVLMLGSRHCLRDQIMDACPSLRKGDSQVRTAADGSSLDTLRNMVASGLGITILPNSSLAGAQHGNNLANLRMEGRGMKRRVALAWRLSFPRTKAIDALHKAIMLCDINVKFL